MSKKAFSCTREADILLLFTARGLPAGLLSHFCSRKGFVVLDMLGFWSLEDLEVRGGGISLSLRDVAYAREERGGGRD